MVDSMQLAEVLGLGIRLALTSWLVAVAVWDWRRAIIPNWLTLPVMLVAGGVRFYHGEWLVLALWVLFYLIWRVNIIGGGDSKLLMGLFALFPTLEFALLFVVLLLAVYVPMIIARHWGKRPTDLATAVFDRIRQDHLLPTREELEAKGQQHAWSYCLSGAIYLWWLW